MTISREEIEKYLAMPHSIQVKKDEGGFFVSIPDLSGCFSQGDTLGEAYTMIMDAKSAWIEAALKNGEIIPEPSEEKKHSGKILLRIPPQLHAELAKVAIMQGVSLNQYLTYLLTRENQKMEFHYHHTNQITVNKVEVQTTAPSREALPRY